MIKEAASAGFYTSPSFAATPFPRLQILTIQDLLSGKSIDFPRLYQTTFKQAPKHKGKPAESLLFDLS